MAKKRRSLKLQKLQNLTTTVESDEESGCEQKKEDGSKRRVLRLRTTKKPGGDSSKTSDAYDADSETELKQPSEIAASSTPSTSVTTSSCDAFVLPKPKISLEKLKALPSTVSTEHDTNSRETKKSMFTNLKDFSVNLEDCMQKSCKNTSKRLVATSDIQTPRNLMSLADERKGKDQENVTPPDIHSTPCLIGKVAKNLDESLFGFNDEVEKVLEYSSINTDSVAAPSPTSPSVLSTHSNNTSFARKTYSRSKRKFDLGFNDLPIEETNDAKIKRPKKKKKDTSSLANNVRKEEELWESLRQQFQEVEMHELIVE